ncbi:hypothetical protein ANN_06831 [Periplaneta americana]|uniref:Uncharacterized protein n=1 Tax=Periplaneta americana TaxID=6978 RepID=A0ABQ8TFC4_PERAM|nr:hypothetical protein ANN_06831 [Periplaneta americana]
MLSVVSQLLQCFYVQCNEKEVESVGAFRGKWENLEYIHALVLVMIDEIRRRKMGESRVHTCFSIRDDTWNKEEVESVGGFRGKWENLEYIRAFTRARNGYRKAMVALLSVSTCVCRHAEGAIGAGQWKYCLFQEEEQMRTSLGLKTKDRKKLEYTRNKIEHPNIPSATRSVSHSNEIPIPIPLDCWTLKDYTERSGNPEQVPSTSGSEFEGTDPIKRAKTAQPLVFTVERAEAGGENRDAT